MRAAFSLALAFLVTALVPPARAQEVAKYPPEAVLQLIHIFDKDPLSERGRSAQLVILEFADKNPDVLVNISERAMPWMNDEAVPEVARVTLTCAYVAGSVRSQLERKVNANDALAGWKQLFRTYDIMRKRSVSLRVAGVEELIADEKEGKLKARALEVDSGGRDSI